MFPFIMFIIMSGLLIIISCGVGASDFWLNTPVSCEGQYSG
jgi:hypothetical protein